MTLDRTLGRAAAAFAAIAAGSVATSAAAQQVDPILLNMRELGGVVEDVSASSRNSGIDDPTEALGNPVGPVEPATFIFADNGPGGVEVLGVNLTSFGTTVSGLRISGGGAGAAPGDPSTISTVDIYGSFGTRPPKLLGSIADFNDAAGFDDVLFAHPETVDQLAIQSGTPEQGARVTEIDAIVPEPSSLAVLGAGAALLLRRRQSPLGRTVCITERQ